MEYIKTGSREMKKLNFKVSVCLSTLLLTINNVYAASIPSDYKKVFSDNGVTLNKNEDGDIFAVSFNFSKASIVVSTPEATPYDPNRFYKESIAKHWYGNNSSKLKFALNGQFFGSFSDGTASLSFPLKSKGTIIKDGDDNKGIDKSTLYMYDYKIRGKTYQVPIIFNGPISSKSHEKFFTSKKVKNSITGVNAKKIGKNFSPSSPIGRHYIGCDDTIKSYNERTLAACGNIIILIGKKSTHKEMMAEFNRFGIKDNRIIAMDGSGSSQLYTDTANSALAVYGVSRPYVNYSDKRILPNSILIYSR